MTNFRRLLMVCIIVAICLSLDASGSGRGEPISPKLAAPTVFPAPGIYPTTESLAFFSTDPVAQIHYTLDGSEPNATSPVFNPSQLLFLAGRYDGDKGLKTDYTVRAIATKQGALNSDVATFQFTIDRKDRTAYVSEEVLPGVRMIRDSENDKMFLVKGTSKAVLIDTGMGRGALKDYVKQYTGSLPIELILTHNHGDHIGQVDQFPESVMYTSEADRSSIVQRLARSGIPEITIQNNLKVVKQGDRIDMGNGTLVIYEVPGHTRGCIVVLDERDGTLFCGDSFGSNNPTVPDALWMQSGTVPIDTYLSTIRVARAPMRGKVKAIVTGHNDLVLKGETYLDNLEAAAQALVDKEDEVLIPSYRPAGVWQAAIGDRTTNPDWASINVTKGRILSSPPDKIATLSYLEVNGAPTLERFSPATLTYTAAVPPGAATARIRAVATSTRYKSLTINGTPVTSGSPYEVKLAAPQSDLAITVTSPDGSVNATYTVKVNRQQ